MYPELIGVKKFKSIIANPDRKNIFLKKVFCHGQDGDAIPSILEPIARDPLWKKLTIHSLFIATVALGIGVDMPHICHIVHIVPPTTVKAYLQETGHAERWQSFMGLLVL